MFLRQPAVAGTRRRLTECALATLLCAGQGGGAAAPPPAVDPARPVARTATSAADLDRDGLSDRAELGAIAVGRPALTPLTTALAQRSSRPVRLLFLGSSTTGGVGASALSSRYVDQVVTRLQQVFPTAGGARSVRDLQHSTDRPDVTPGVQGVNGALGGATAATYFTDAHEYGVGVVQPSCVVHMIGSNDSVARVPLAPFRDQVDAVLQRIDDASERPPCHVLLQPVRRYQVDPATWAAYGDVLEAIAQSHPRVTYADLGAAFEARDALGTDPDGLIGPDGVHPTDAGHALLAATLLDALALTRRGIGTGTDPARADTDRDGIADKRELRSHVIVLDVVPCKGPDIRRARVRTLPYERDTDGDGLSDRRELEGYRLLDARVVRSDPEDADTDGDGADDGREWLSRRGDPVTCRGRRPAG